MADTAVDVKDDIKDDVKEDVKEYVKEDVKEEAKVEVKEDAKDDVKAEAAEAEGDLSASVGTPVKETLSEAKPAIVTEILEKPELAGDDKPTALEADIIKQVEYYFSDSNLARDKFLGEEMAKDDGWVPFSVLLTFKRLLALSEDANVIVDALLKSKNDLLQFSKDRLKVRRNPARPVPEQNEETRKLTIARTAYAKGFPADIQMTTLLKYFDKYENVTNVIMRRYVDKPSKEYKFKGSIFVAFGTKENCAKFLADEKVEYEGTPLLRMWQSDYYDSKKAERQSDKKKNKKPEEPEITLPKGAVIYLEGLAPESTRESIKDAISKLGGEVAFIDYTKGDKTGHVRLTAADSAKPVVDKLTDSKLKVDSAEAVARILEGDEETQFLVKVVENMKTRRNQGNRFKGGRNNRYQSNRKRKGDSGDEPASKHVRA